MKQHVDIRLLGVLKSDLKSYCMAEDVKRGNAWERRMREKTWTNKHTSTMKDRAASPTASASAMENSIGGIPSHHLSIAPRRQHATKTVYVTCDIILSYQSVLILDTWEDTDCCRWRNYEPFVLVGE